VLVQNRAMTSVAVDKKAKKKAEKAAAAEADAAPVKKTKKAKKVREVSAEEQPEHKVKKKKRKAEDAGTAADGAAAAPRKAKKAKKQAPSPAASDSAASVQSGLQLGAAAAPPPAAEGPGARRRLSLATQAARLSRACEPCGHLGAGGGRVTAARGAMCLARALWRLSAFSRRAGAAKDAPPAEDPLALDNFPLADGIRDLLRGKGIGALFPIQAQTLRSVLDGADLVGRARCAACPLRCVRACRGVRAAGVAVLQEGAACVYLSLRVCTIGEQLWGVRCA